MRKICIMDIDETLTLFREDKDVIVQDAFTRAQGGEHFSTAWAEWNATLVDDIPNMEMVTLYHSLVEQGYTMVVLSARGIANYDVTVEWLRKFGLTYEMLLLRPEELENVGSGPYKEEMINRHLGSFEDIMLAVDDSGSVLKMFTENDVPTIKP